MMRSAVTRHCCLELELTHFRCPRVCRQSTGRPTRWRGRCCTGRRSSTSASCCPPSRPSGLIHHVRPSRRRFRQTTVPGRWRGSQDNLGSQRIGFAGRLVGKRKHPRLTPGSRSRKEQSRGVDVALGNLRLGMPGFHLHLHADARTRICRARIELGSADCL